MNKLMIIGNLTKDPETRATQAGKEVCNFTVAVNRRAQRGERQEADYFRVSAWNDLGRNCQKFLAKGRKVCVIGSVGVRTYTANDGNVRANLEVNAQDVEFLSHREDYRGGDSDSAYGEESRGASEIESGYGIVETDELPF